MTEQDKEIFEKYCKLEEALRIAKEALRALNNEVAAMIATHEDVIAQDYGRTNLECLTYRLNLARLALEKIDEVLK